MRDMNKYLFDFDNLPFELIQSEYRKKKFLENLDRFGEIYSALEVGCGESSIYEKVSFKENFLIEPIQEFCERLSQRINTSDLVIINQFLEDFNVDKKFDLIVLSCILHEVENQDQFLTKAISLLNPGGILYVDVPNAKSLHRYFAVATGYLNSINQASTTQFTMQQSNNIFTKESLCAYLNNYNLEIIECESYFIKPFHHQKMQELCDIGMLTKVDLDGFYTLGDTLKDLGSELYAILRKPYV